MPFSRAARGLFLDGGGAVYRGLFTRLLSEFKRASVLRRKVSAVSPNKSISGAALYTTGLYGYGGKKMTLRSLRRSALQRRAPVGRVSFALIAGSQASLIEPPASTSYW